MQTLHPQTLTTPTATTVTHLKIAAALVIGFGLVTAMAAVPALAAPVRLFMDIVLWRTPSPTSLTTPEARLFCAIIGGLTVGLGVFCWLVATRLFPRDPVLARSLIVSGMGAWFVVDSTASILAGAASNVPPNAVFLLAFLVPLWLAKRNATLADPAAR